MSQTPSARIEAAQARAAALDAAGAPLPPSPGGGIELDLGGASPPIEGALPLAAIAAAPLGARLVKLNAAGMRASEWPALPGAAADGSPGAPPFPALRTLFLLGNAFAAVPAALGALPALYMLSLKSNAVEQVPEESLAPTLTRVVAPGGVLVLSGLIERDVPGVLSAYRLQGFSLVSRGLIEGWVALVLMRGGAAKRPRRRG